jgi:glycosyltransferase involved in cell wall biosynthesis
MRSSVIIPTYNEPDRLALVLEGLLRQSQAPDEVCIGDDGSGPKTQAVIEGFQGRFRSPIVHAWHPDDGFRKWAVCNEAVRRSSGDWLLFIDGDSIPHRHWVRDHLQWSHRGDVLCGRRVKLGPHLSPKVDAQMVRSGALERWSGPAMLGALKGDTERMGLGIRLPGWLAAALHPRPRKLMGVNFSLSRKAFEGVNGYDSLWPGRRGDRDIDLRLRRGGYRFVAVIGRAIVYHLHHLERPNSEAIQARVAEEERSARVQCEVGLRDLRASKG